MHFGTLPGQNPVYPVLRPETSHFFMHPNDVDPWEANGVITSALKFGAHFDLLAMTQPEDKLLNGEVDVTDCIDPNLSISAMYYRTKNGNVHKLDLTGIPLTNFTFVEATNPGRLELNLTVKVSKWGVPKTFLGKLFHTLLDCFNQNELVPVHIYGFVNLQFGTVQVDYTCDEFDIRPLGYTLQAYRINHNRRPAGQCPYMG